MRLKLNAYFDKETNILIIKNQDNCPEGIYSAIFTENNKNFELPKTINSIKSALTIAKQIIGLRNLLNYHTTD